tara:strand:+ start:3602 stop:4150 length:549 start_codon:yes stop_codon:yes gene_type:complete
MSSLDSLQEQIAGLDSASDLDALVQQIAEAKQQLRQNSLSSLKGEVDEILAKNKLSVSDLFSVYEKELKAYVGGSVKATTTKDKWDVSKDYALLTVKDKMYLIVKGKGNVSPDLQQSLHPEIKLEQVGKKMETYKAALIRQCSDGKSYRGLQAKKIHEILGEQDNEPLTNDQLTYVNAMSHS